MRKPDHGIIKGLLLGTVLSGLLIAGLNLLLPAQQPPMPENTRRFYEALIHGYGC